MAYRIVLTLLYLETCILDMHDLKKLSFSQWAEAHHLEPHSPDTELET
jgi:hypothetical protein